MDSLTRYLPENTYPMVHKYLIDYKVSLTITRRRKSVLGDYRRPYKGYGHRISVNGDLNKYAFLLTLLHELAHLMAFEKYGIHITPHGREWKSVFSGLLRSFNTRSIFPEEIRRAVHDYMQDPSASSCSDESLVRVLRKYDAPIPGTCLVEELKEGEHFLVPGGQLFRRERKLRKRFECREVKTGHLYIFSPLYEVKKYKNEGGDFK